MSIAGPTSDHTLIQRWAETHLFVPAEKLPDRVDGEPAELCFVSAAQATNQKDIRLIAWADFFAKFDLHGLALVYDDTSDFNEILQVEAKSPYRRPEQQSYPIEN